MTATDYDVIVVGASFAGLAVARRLRGRVLLIDRHEIGAVQTSACGTPLWVPHALGVASSVLQVHDRLNLRTPDRVISYDLSAVPFCTFDYKAFCVGLFEQTHARFLRAGVTGYDGAGVTTTDGRFTAPVVVDCSGWRGAVVRAGADDRAGGDLSFGLETYTTRSDRGLWLLLDQQLIRSGLGWIFPVGVGSLIGLGSYVGDSKLRPRLERLLREEGVMPSQYHGTFFPNRLLRPTVDRVFAVGDAAGQCLPLTAEGIRPALYFGGECGKIIQHVLDGALPLEAALERYRQVVERYRRPYRILQRVQWLAAHLPTRWFACLSSLAARRPILPHWWPRYGWFGRFDQTPIASAS